jgi:RHS repeat-associated protein
LERFIATPCQAGEWLHQLRNVPRIGVPGIDGPGSDEPLVWYEGAGISDRRFPLADERGSIIAITNASGSVTNINAYDEYGIPASSNVGRFGYTGQTWLPEVGMNYYKARIYSPTLGRFLQSDPIGYADGVNFYNYVGSDPVNGVDPSGLEICDGCTIKVTSGGGGSGFGGFFGRLQPFDVNLDGRGSIDSGGDATDGPDIDVCDGGPRGGNGCAQSPQDCGPSGTVIFTGHDVAAFGLVGYSESGGFFNSRYASGHYLSTAFGYGFGLASSNVVGFSRNLSTFMGGNDNTSFNFPLAPGAVSKANDLDGEPVGATFAATGIAGRFNPIGRVSTIGGYFSATFSNTEIIDFKCK